MPAPMPLVLIPALLCDEELYRDMMPGLGGRVTPEVVMSPRSTLASSVTAILGRVPPEFVLAGTSYGASLAIEVALAALSASGACGSWAAIQGRPTPSRAWASPA